LENPGHPSFDFAGAVLSYRSSLKIRLMKKRMPWQAFAIAINVLAALSIAHAEGRAAASPRPVIDPGQNLIRVAEEQKHEEPLTIVLAIMSGKCTRLKIAGRDFGCRAIAFFQTEEGRANFVIALDDPADNSHIITFSGDNGRRPQDNLYELPIDRMLLKSKDRPKEDGLPVPQVELSAGMCKQVGVFASRQVSSVSCSAVDKKGRKYDLQYESDGSPIDVRRVRQTPVGTPAISPFD
jgi:hypothetical protein